MGRSRYKIYEATHPHFVTCTILHWLPIFAGKILGGIAAGMDNISTTTRTILMSIAGGTASVLGGGKFSSLHQSPGGVYNHIQAYKAKI